MGKILHQAVGLDSDCGLLMVNYLSFLTASDSQLKKLISAAITFGAVLLHSDLGMAHKNEKTPTITLY